MNKKMLAYGVFLGGVVGAAAALLYAPLSGKELRRQLKENKDDWIKIATEFKENATELKESVTKLSQDGKEIIKELATDVKIAVEEWQNEIGPTKEAMQNEIKNIQKTIAELENKLQEGKEVIRPS